ncbi:MAG: ABC transporter ATP-binding protein/permease [Lachnospiraceae bacterium]|nr:ABC transporter ATP-binding protein/permease [Lachnospiraceae bacterium]
MKQKSSLKILMNYLKPYSFKIIISLTCAVINVVMTLYTPIIIADAIDLIAYEGFELTRVSAILTRAFIVALIAGASQLIMNNINNDIAFMSVKDIRNDAFKKLQKLPLGYIDRNPQGGIVSRIIADVDQLSDGLIMGFTQLFTGIMTILGTLIFMVRMNYRIAAVVIVLTPVSLFIAKFVTSKTYTLFSKQSSIRGDQTALINEILNNFKVVKAYSHEEATLEDYEEINSELKDASLKAIFYSSLTNPATRFVNSLIYAAVTLFGALVVISGGMTIGTLVCFLNYATQYTKPFNEITGVITELQNALACAGRIFQLINEERESSDDDSLKLSDPSGNVFIDKVDFSYLPDKKLIENLSLSVKSGERIAIVGPTGCGKTTIINLLMRFYDVNEGSISLEGEFYRDKGTFSSKEDIRNITRKSLRSSYGMVLQETWLRNATVLDNIRIGKPHATREEVIAAAKECHAHSFIRRLEKGYDTMISEDGGQLSQGQKQLLCISRVMLALPQMLILDEATSSIDTRTEMRIQDAFLKLMQGRTTFIVAHRLSTIKNSDLILVMKDGKVIEQGKHLELLEKKGFYSKLYKAGSGLE